MTISLPRRLATPLGAITIAAVLAACAGGTTTTASAGPAEPAGAPCPTSQPEPLPAGETRSVTISTNQGEMVIGVEADLSPIAAGNFVALAECGFYDGSPFHRVATLQDGTPFVIQGGDQPGGLGYTIQDELVSTPYVRGTVAMARTGEPNSVTSQFFIVLDDGAGDILASYNTYQIIGNVTSGMDTADAIYTAAGGVELPPEPVVMDSVTVGNP